MRRSLRPQKPAAQKGRGCDVYLNSTVVYIAVLLIALRAAQIGHINNVRFVKNFSKIYNFVNG